MIKVYSNENVMLVEHMKNLLGSNGISSFVKNQNMQSFGVGAGSISWPELWLHDDKLNETAAALIKLHSEKNTAESEMWKCADCSETNEAQFNICWKCSHSKMD